MTTVVWMIQLSLIIQSKYFYLHGCNSSQSYLQVASRAPSSTTGLRHRQQLPLRAHIYHAQVYTPRSSTSHPHVRRQVNCARTCPSSRPVAVAPGTGSAPPCLLRKLDVRGSSTELGEAIDIIRICSGLVTMRKKFELASGTANNSPSNSRTTV